MPDPVDPRQGTSAAQHGDSGASIPRESLARTRRQTVRLTVSIPAIISLVVIAGGVFVRNQLITTSQQKGLSVAVREGLDYSADLVTLFTIIMAILSAGVGLLLALQIVRPLRDIEESMAALARGELAQMRNTPLGEFSYIGSTFNSMVTHLEHLFAERDRQMKEAAARARFLIARDGTILSAEGAVRRIMGISPREIIGHRAGSPFADAPDADVGRAVLDACARVLADPRPGNSVEEDLNLIRGGEPLALNMILSPIVTGERGVDQWLLEVRDITGAQSFREQMQRADRLAAVGTLATGIAHEIRNPLASMKGMMQLLDEQSRSGQPPLIPPQEYHQRIIGEIERLERLVNAIMDFAQGDPEPPGETDLNDLMRSVAEGAMLSAGSETHLVQLRMEFDPNLPMPFVQHGRLRQALLNLARNAVEHVVEHGGGVVRISTMYLPVNELRPVILCVANTCERLSPDELERLFEPFHTTKAGGTGLGLAIAYQAVVSNGGVLETDWEDGEIRFWVRLPMDARMDLRRSSGVVRKTPVPAE